MLVVTFKISVSVHILHLRLVESFHSLLHSNENFFTGWFLWIFADKVLTNITLEVLGNEVAGNFNLLQVL